MDVREYIDFMMNDIAEQAFDDHSENCEGCKFYTKTTDPFGTGDSPTEWECERNEDKDCMKVQEAIQIIKQEL